jgi:hypothetical protein
MKGADEPIVFTISIENKGNVRDTYNFAIKSRHTWARFLNEEITLTQGDTGQVKFEINPPEDIVFGEFDFNVFVFSMLDQEKERDLTLKAIIYTLEFSIFEVYIDGREVTDISTVKVVAGTEIKLTIIVKNTGSMNFEGNVFSECPVLITEGNTEISRQYIDFLPSQKLFYISVDLIAPKELQEYVIYVDIDPDEELPLTNRDNLVYSTLIKSANLNSVQEKNIGTTYKKTSSQFLLIFCIIIIFASLMSLILLKARKARKEKEKLLKQEYIQDNIARATMSSGQQTGTVDISATLHTELGKQVDYSKNNLDQSQLQQGT